MNDNLEDPDPSCKDIIKNLCRCCGYQTQIAQQKPLDGELLDLYNKITLRKLQEWNNMPKIVCQKCISQFNSIKYFINRCIAADDKFNVIAKEVLGEGNNIKTEDDEENDPIFLVNVVDENPAIPSKDFKDERTIQDADDWMGACSNEDNDDTDEDATPKNKTEEVKPPETAPKRSRYKKRRKMVSVLTCYTCKKRFNRGARNVARQELKDHYKNSEGCKPKQWPCTVCSKIFNHKSDLEAHGIVHSSELNYKCDQCESCFKQESSLARHYKSKHNDADPMLCEYCPKNFKILDKLQQHVRNCHPDKLSIACTLCPRKFICNQGLKRHMDSIHPNGILKKPPNPNQNPSSTKPKKVYKQVIKYTLCTICGIKCARGHLQLHLNKHQGIKPFECEHCPKKFFTKQELKLHTNRHLGIKPFPCNLCEGAFASKTELSIHMRKHTGEKPYECPHCHKCWARKNYLREHIRTHTGERPYDCPHCPKAFPTRTVLLGHIKTHVKNGTIDG